jgi:hypothetical protein
MASSGYVSTNNCVGNVTCSRCILSSIVVLTANGNFWVVPRLQSASDIANWLCKMGQNLLHPSPYCELKYLNKCSISVSAYIFLYIYMITPILNLQYVKWALCRLLTEQNLPKLPASRERVSGPFWERETERECVSFVSYLIESVECYLCHILGILDVGSPAVFW